MPLNIVKSIPLKYAATSIVLIDGGVITTTGVDSFSVVYDIKLNKPKPALVNQFDGASGRRKSLFSGGNTVVELMDSSNKALVFYAGKEFELRFGGRAIVNVAVSEDGGKVACVLADIPMKLDEAYYQGVDNVYVIELESFALSVMAFQSQLGDRRIIAHIRPRARAWGVCYGWGVGIVVGNRASAIRIVIGNGAGYHLSSACAGAIFYGGCGLFEVVTGRHSHDGDGQQTSFQ